MGWTETTWIKGTKIIDFFKEKWDCEDEKKRLTVLDASLVHRKHAYAAIERIDKETNKREVFAATYIITFRKGYYNIAYKDMTEHCGPGMDDCPERIMNLLTPITKPEKKECGDHYAREWRATNWKVIRKRKHNKRKGGRFKCGDTIVFRRPLKFNNGTEHKSLRVATTKPLRFTDGTCNIFGYESRIKIKRSTIDYMLEKIIPAGIHYEPKIVMPDINDKNINKYPIFRTIDSDDDFHCIAWGHAKGGWEWFAFEIVDKEQGIYYGYVMGWASEFGNFSAKELLEAGVQLITDPKELNRIMPPSGWYRVA